MIQDQAARELEPLGRSGEQIEYFAAHYGNFYFTSRAEKGF
jgi:hypothetical protein